MSRKKICIVGHFAFGQEAMNGQTIKTKIITSELERQLGKNEVIKIDTSAGKKGLVKLFFQVISEMKRSKNTVMLPAHNGIRYFTPLLYLGKKIFHSKIHYIVIGGWLPEFIKNKKILKNLLRNFDAIYVETHIMKELLEKQGFKNIIVMPNCKELSILNENKVSYREKIPFKLCTFSRVLKEKGIEDAINAVESINKKYKKVIFELDIYGQIDEKYATRFKTLQNDFPNYISYGGVVPYDKSGTVLKEYYALLFPTYYPGEGLAGTLIDAMAAGLPVIASDWKYNPELVLEYETGFLFKTGNVDSLIEKLEQIQENPEICNNMREKCIKRAYSYLPSNVVKILLTNME